MIEHELIVNEILKQSLAGSQGDPRMSPSKFIADFIFTCMHFRYAAIKIAGENLIRSSRQTSEWQFL